MSDTHANLTEQIPQPDNAPTHVVGVGASAGGLEPIKHLFAKMPADSGAAFVISQHLLPDYDGLMEPLLKGVTPMRLLSARHEMVLEANRIYLNSADQELTVVDGRFKVAERDDPKEPYSTINLLFKSLAIAYREQAIAIVLSGSGDDGADGAAHVKGRGGLVIVQSPETADYKSMPRSAIASADPDWVVPPDEMPLHLMAYIDMVTRNTSLAGEKYNMPMDPQRDYTSLLPPQDQSAYDRILKLLEGRFKIDFSAYKTLTIHRRIDRRMALMNVDSPQAYVARLERSPDELDDIYRDMLVDVTYFFRDESAFEIMAQDVIPRIVEDTPAQGEIRMWVAGCASGEEAYSIGILLLEEMERQEKYLEVRIFATDGHQESIERASAGIFREESCKPVSPERLERFFIRVKDGYQVTKPLRDLMVFAHQDLLNSSPFTRLDLVTCRNVLIYFETKAQQQLLSNFHYSLKTDGTLFLGSSEHLGALEDEFGIVDRQWRIFRKLRDVVLPTVHIAMPAVVQHVQRQGEASLANSKAILNRLASGDTGSTQSTNRLPANRQSAGITHATRDPRSSSSSTLPSSTLPSSTLPSSTLPSTSMVSSSWPSMPNEPFNRQRPDNGWMESLLLSLISSGVVLDPKSEILYIFGDAQQYLHLRLGYGTLNIFDLLDGDLVAALRLAVAQIIGGEDRIVLENVETKRTNGDLAILKTTVVGIDEHEHLGRRIFVGFEDTSQTAEKPKTIDMSAVPIERVEQLQHELMVTRETLQSMVEEQETTNEELSASNEELQASNEELSATNEELFTVNTEFQRSIAELTKLSTDMDNLQTSTQIGIIFLDSELTIQFFTKPAADLLGLVEADIGRTVNHLTFFNLSIDNNGLKNAVDAVLAGEDSAELETKPWNGSIYSLRVLPYLDEASAPQGVVLTVQDVSDRKEREQLLMEKELYMEVMAGLFFVLDREANVVSINPHGLAMLGYEADELIGKNWFDMVHPEEVRADLKASFDAKAFLDEFPLAGPSERELTTKSGQRITVLRQSARLRDERGATVALVTSGYDITERKRTEIDLAERTSQLRTIADNLPAFVGHMDAKLNFRFVNKHFAEFLNGAADDLVGQSLLDAHKNIGLNVTHDSYKDALNGEIVSYEHSVPNPDGDEPHAIQITLIPEVVNDEVVGVFSLGVDVSEIRQQARFIEAIATTSPSFIYLFSLDEQRNLFLNRDLAKELGYSADEIQQMGEEFLPTVMHPDDWATQANHWQKVIDSQEGEVIEREYRVRHQDGSWHWLLSQEQVFRRDEMGTVLEILGTGTDITQLKDVEAALKESERFLMAAFEASPATTYIYDVVEERNIFTSRDGPNESGYTAEEIQAMGSKLLTTLVHPDDYARRPQHYAALAAAPLGDYVYQEFRIRNRDGEWRWIASRDVVYERAEDGSILKVLGSRLDITEQKKAETSLATTTHQLRTIADNMPVWIAYIDGEYRYQFANRYYETTLGIAPGEIIGCLAKDVLGLYGYDESLPYYERAMTGESVHFEKWAQLGDREVCVALTLVPDIADEVVNGFYVLGVDITNVKAVELALEETTSQLISITDNLPARISYVDKNLVVQFANKRFVEFTGLSRDEIVGSSVMDMIGLEAYERDKDNINTVLTGTPITFEMERSQGEASGPIYELATFVPHVVDDIEGYFALIIDVTELKNSEIEISALNKHLRELNASLEERVQQRTQELEDANQELLYNNDKLDRFVSIAAHDLKEPLRGLHAYTEILTETLEEQLPGGAEDDVNQILSKMAKLTKRTNQLLEELRNYVRIGRNDSNTESVELDTIVDDIIAILQPLVIEANIEFLRPHPLPTVQYNSAHLMTIFQNLVTNAIKYNTNEHKEVEIGMIQENDRNRTQEESDTSLGPRSDQTPSTIFYIRDNGIGIPERHHDRIFEMFKRLHPEEHYGGGMGAGLALVKRIVEQNGGQIWVESELNEGTVFYFTL